MGDDVFQQGDVLFQGGAVQHDAVPLPPHADGDDVLVPAAALQPILPVAEQALFVCLKIPVAAVNAVLAPNLVPFLAGPEAGLVVGVAHHHAV